MTKLGLCFSSAGLSAAWREAGLCMSSRFKASSGTASVPGVRPDDLDQLLSVSRSTVPEHRASMGEPLARNRPWASLALGYGPMW